MIFAGDDSSYLCSGAVFSGHAVDVCIGGGAQEGRRASGLLGPVASFQDAGQ